MKRFRYFIYLIVISALFASCATQNNKRAPVNGWHKRDHWYDPSNWHKRNAPTPF